MNASLRMILKCRQSFEDSEAAMKCEDVCMDVSASKVRWDCDRLIVLEAVQDPRCQNCDLILGCGCVQVRAFVWTASDQAASVAASATDAGIRPKVHCDEMRSHLVGRGHG
jgi:hypothetical protein